MKKMYIGYDLGDGETIANVIFHDSESAVKETPKDLTMAGEKKEGQAVPTAFALNADNEVVFASTISQDSENLHDIHTNFKRRPSDLVMAGVKPDMFGNERRDWPSAPEANQPEMLEYKENVRRFTNAIFENAGFQDRLRGLIAKQGDVEEVVVCVGHPTKWNRLDCAIYEKILRQSVLGNDSYLDIPLKLIVAAESRAAFLYVRDSGTKASRFQNMALLIDVGSSTVDLTAVEANTKNSAYNTGHNYLGARIIDALIMEWYLEQLRDKGDYEEYLNVIGGKPEMENALLLLCRLAKEQIYGSDSAVARIVFADFRPVRLSRDTLEDLMEQPIAPVMKKYFSYEEDVIAQVGDLSWRKAFEQFLREQKAVMENMDFRIENIILTGSASKMPVVSKTVKSVFSLPTFFDNEPSKTISRGLALVGYSNDKSADFQLEAENILRHDIPRIIQDDIPELADKLSERITNWVCDDMIIPKLKLWKAGGYSTVQQLLDDVEEECAGDNLAKKIENDEQCAAIMREWMSQKLGRDIALKLHNLCEKFGVEDVSIDQLNFLEIKTDASAIRGNLDESVAQGILSSTDVLLNIVAVLTGILAYTVTPFLLGVIAGILMIVAETIGFLLFDLLLAIPGIGWTALLVIAGIAAGKAVRGQLKGMRDELSKKIIAANLPLPVRKLVPDKKLYGSIENQRPVIRGKIAYSLQEEESIRSLTDKIHDALSEQIETVLNDMKYIIESQ